MLENGDKLELEILDELSISVGELEDDASEEERDEDKIELLDEDDEELLAIKEDDELLSDPIEDDELVDDVIEELLHTSTVLQTLTS